MTDERRRIVFVWAYLQWGGAQIYFIAIIKVAIAKWDVTVVLPRASSPEIIRLIEETGATIEYLDVALDMDPATTPARKISRHITRIKTERAILKHLKRFRLRDCVVHVETSPWQSWIFVTMLCRRGAHVFITMHNALPRFPFWRELVWKARMQFLSRLRGFHIFTSNQDTKDKIRAWVSPSFWEQIAVTYTCVNPPEIDQAKEMEFDRVGTREALNIEPYEHVVLSVGQFIDRKGRWTLLDAIKRLKASHSDLKFLWVTPQMPSAADSEQIAGYELGETFQLVLSETLGNSHLDVLRFFRIADMFVLPSFVEGLPIALLEAMAMGVPSISTRINAIPEAVLDRETGLLVEAGDAVALAEAIETLKADTHLRRQLAENGSRFVLERFDERVASRIAIAEYEKCFQHP